MNRYDRGARLFAYCLAAVAGFVDAVSYLLTGGRLLPPRKRKARNRTSTSCQGRQLVNAPHKRDGLWRRSLPRDFPVDVSWRQS